MRRYSRLGAINRFNGGLFAVDPELDGLTIPNQAFCVGSSLVVEYFKGELRILDEGIAVLDAIFVAPEEAAQIAIHWRQVLRENPIMESTLAARLASALRRVRHTPNKALASQIAELDRELRDLEHNISKTEKDLNTAVRALYALTTEEAAILQPAPT